MAGYERTRKGIRNSLVAVAVQFVSLLVGFFSRKIFLDYLGTEVLGLNTTATSLLNFLNLAEMGIETAIAFTLYKPLYEKDEVSIREIIAIQGWFYRRVALFIIAGSLALMPFFPLIFTKMQLPMWYAYASYLVLLFSALLGYFVNYKQVILTADQQDYKFQMSYRLTMIVKVLFQMLSVKFLDHPYVWWLVWEAVFAIAAAIKLNFTVYRNYPFLKQSCKVDRELVRKYPSILSKIKQIFVHKISFFATYQAIPLFIYAYASLTDVALYGNYMVIVNSLQALLIALFASLTSSVGNMIVEGNRTLIIKVFNELFTSRFLFVAFCSFALIYLTEPFISLWIGPGYLLSRSTLLLIVLIFYLRTMRTVVDLYIDACGIYWDVWSPLTEVALFIVLALVLGPKYALDGILLASSIEMILIVFIWKPIFLFKYGIKQNTASYFLRYLRHLCIGAVAFLISWYLIRFIEIDPASGILPFLEYSMICCALFGGVLMAMLYFLTDSLKGFLDRVIKTLFRRQTV